MTHSENPLVPWSDPNSDPLSDIRKAYKSAGLSADEATARINELNAALGGKINTDEDLNSTSEMIRANDPSIPIDIALEAVFGGENLDWTRYHLVQEGWHECTLCGLHEKSWTTHCPAYVSWMTHTTMQWVSGSRLDFCNGDWWFEKSWIAKHVADSVARNKQKALDELGQPIAADAVEYQVINGIVVPVKFEIIGEGIATLKEPTKTEPASIEWTYEHNS